MNRPRKGLLLSPRIAGFAKRSVPFFNRQRDLVAGELRTPAKKPPRIMRRTATTRPATGQQIKWTACSPISASIMPRAGCSHRPTAGPTGTKATSSAPRATVARRQISEERRAMTHLYARRMGAARRSVDRLSRTSMTSGQGKSMRRVPISRQRWPTAARGRKVRLVVSRRRRRDSAALVDYKVRVWCSRSATSGCDAGPIIVGTGLKDARNFVSGVGRRVRGTAGRSGSRRWRAGDSRSLRR